MRPSRPGCERWPAPCAGPVRPYFPACFFFQLGDAGFQCGQLFAGAGEQCRLDVEFLAGDQVHLLEHAGEQGLDVFSISRAGLAAISAESLPFSSSKILGSSMDRPVKTRRWEGGKSAHAPCPLAAAPPWRARCGKRTPLVRPFWCVLSI